MPRASPSKGLQCPTCRVAMRVDHTTHPVENGYIRRVRKCPVCGGRQSSTERFVGPFKPRKKMKGSVEKLTTGQRDR